MSCFTVIGLSPTLGASGFNRADDGRYSTTYLLLNTIKTILFRV